MLGDARPVDWLHKNGFELAVNDGKAQNKRRAKRRVPGYRGLDQAPMPL